MSLFCGILTFCTIHIWYLFLWDSLYTILIAFFDHFTCFVGSFNILSGYFVCPFVLRFHFFFLNCSRCRVHIGILFFMALNDAYWRYKLKNYIFVFMSQVPSEGQNFNIMFYMRLMLYIYIYIYNPHPLPTQNSNMRSIPLLTAFLEMFLHVPLAKLHFTELLLGEDEEIFVKENARFLIHLGCLS